MMATIESTPPPTSAVRTPPTPRLGWEDDYQPYASRKSARLSARRQRSTQTPPPPSSSSASRQSHASSRAAHHSTSPPSSPPTARKRDRAHGFLAGASSSRRVSGALTEDSTSSAAEALGLSPPPQKMSKSESLRPASAVRGSGMLPTPSKTPRKDHLKNDVSISSVARNLFARTDLDDVMPSPRKNKKKTPAGGFTLDSLIADDEPPLFEIYNDSQDRIPQKDTSSANPFYNTNTAGPSEVRISRRRTMIQIPGEGEVTLEEAEKREDGMVYVFRGKKVFRKFSDVAEAEAETAEDDEDVLEADDEEAELHKPLTRSSIKPRLLFPSAKKTPTAEEDEEAVTDIEDLSHAVSTPTKHTHKAVTAQKPAGTPKVSRFALASPPSTARTRGRMTDRSFSPIPIACMDGSDLSDVPEAPKRSTRTGRGKASPFDEWQRKKPIASSSSSSSKKREADEVPVQDEGAISKRLRGHT